MEEDRCYEIRMSSNEKGKGLFAKRPIKEGDIILHEKPLIISQYAWNGDPRYPYSACDNCLAPLDNAETNVCRLTNSPDIKLPYLECCEVKTEFITECDMCSTKYCSFDCKKEAWEKYHEVICTRNKETDESHPLTILMNKWKSIHYPPESFSIMLIVKMVALVRQNLDLKQAFSQFCRGTVNKEEGIMHNILSGKFEKDIDNIRELIQKAVNVDQVPEWFTPDNFRSLLSLIGRNGQGIETSSFACWVKNVENLNLNDDERTEINNYISLLYDKLIEVVGHFLSNEGSGLYLIQSATNHSCSPNADVEFPYSNSTLILKATKDIQENDEIFISYLDKCVLNRSRHSRQKLLRTMYLFHCKCEKCISEADDPDVTSSESECEDEDITE